VSLVYVAARSIALTLLGSGLATERDVVRAVDSALQAVRDMAEGEAIDRDALLREIESKVRVWVGVSGVLDDPRGHQEWLSSRRGAIDWRFWTRYRRWLEEVEALPPLAVTRTDDLTDQILQRLEDPHRPGSWDRRGLIAGQVQSGKTGNYIGLMCKAADAGYKLIIVLAGVHNSLRSQTQLRVDQGFIGYDTQKRRLYSQENVWIGVGRLAGVDRPAVHSLTNSGERGDFNVTVARQAAVDIGGSDPVVLVVKKNQSVLRNLIDWSTTIRQRRIMESERFVVPDVPLLVIDDEADHASVNTADYDEAEPSKINGLIRDLLARFEQSAYVGYTATPFANILIDPAADHPAIKDDLFPRSFIFTLRAPSNYIGPALVFGTGVPTPDETSRAGLPLTRNVEDEELWLPRRHKKTFEPGALPASLTQALRSFVLTIAARRARGQRLVHNSMLVHVTRYVAVQAGVHDLVIGEIQSMRHRLRYGDGNAPVRLVDELAELWCRDFEPTSTVIAGTGLDGQATHVDWPAVKSELLEAISGIEVRQVNGTAKDALQYFENPEGLSIIVVGGDKLSRGLTLEGLSVSYFLRASKMYDTLLQMGRWFGYRPGYLDLCRLYLTPELHRWFTIITEATEELMRLFEEMVEAGGTPSDFGLRIRSNPDGLTVTSPAKSQRGRVVKVSFSGTISETIVFHATQERQDRNLRAAADLVAGLGGADAPNRHLRSVQWNDVEPEPILRFLREYTTHEAAQKAQSKALGDYIRSRVKDAELVRWTVLLASNSKGEYGTVEIGDVRVGLIQRALVGQEDDTVKGDRFSIRRLVNPPDELVDLDDEQIAAALAATVEHWTSERAHRNGEETPPGQPGGVQIRRVREPERGLLILYPLKPPSGLEVGAVIGFAISFPHSDFDSAVDYVVNQVWLQQEFEWEGT
jgi:hypothetical protein